MASTQINLTVEDAEDGAGLATVTAMVDYDSVFRIRVENDPVVIAGTLVAAFQHATSIFIKNKVKQEVNKEANKTEPFSNDEPLTTY